MATINSTERASDERRRIASTVHALYDLWTILDSAVCNGSEQGVACSVAAELLPVIGGKLDALIESRTGCFDDVLSKEGIVIALPKSGATEVCHG
ncbi:hypothetical protein [Burkholderia cenocepacia]|uniref:hypothetical protein n=1 Tax=Burkholderia cenocepacia TaxID=95486 RepID=UPI002AB6A44F|nr:hypothetical protein [Burkholderia cenocepacia]